VSKQWSPRKQTVQLAPSRIRRQPVPVQKAPEPPSPEREVLGGIAGITLFAVALAVLILGVSIATIIHTDPNAAARAARFSQCYDAEGSNCVLDGNTIYIQGQKIEIAGVAAPKIQGAQCDDERSNCVLDGNTIYIQGQKIEIAGVAAPKIQGAQCDDERSRGIDSAVRLADLLNSGKVTVGASVREPDGQLRTRVEVGGNDVATAMINAGMARAYGNTDGWCG